MSKTALSCNLNRFDADGTAFFGDLIPWVVSFSEHARCGSHAESSWVIAQ
jgi:hypothetical protein